MDIEAAYRKRDIVGWVISKLKEFYPNDPVRNLEDLNDIICFQELIIELDFSGKFSFMTDDDKNNWKETLKRNREKFNYKLHKIAEEKGIPIHFYNSRYSTINECLIRRLQSNQSHLFFLDGNRKTYTLCAVLMKLAVDGHTCRYYEAQEAVRKLRENATDAEGFSLEDRLREVSYLFIDDLGNEEHHRNVQLTDLLSHRINYRKHTLIARSPVNLDKFEDRYPVLNYMLSKSKIELIVLE